VFARLFRLTALAFIISASSLSAAGAQDEYTLFESGHVRPMAMSPDGLWLYVCNTADAHIEAYVAGGGTATHVYSIPVGLEPVAVAAPTNNEVWVVNHLSDSISIVDTTAMPPRVVRTLLVGDEPRDIVFASGKAFITTAHRGQNTQWRDGEYDVPGTGRADVWVFNATNPGAGMGGTPITVINLFGDRPRALAASPDGTRVYAAVFRSGNQTVPVNEGLVCDLESPLQSNTETCELGGNTYPGRRLFPITDHNGDLGRETGVIVGFDQGSGHWEDEIGRNWDTAVPFEIPDYDVFEIDAAAATPVQLGPLRLPEGIVEGTPGVGTVLFNMIVNPANGDVYVSNTDANNRVRFEGPGDYATDPDSQPKPPPSTDPATVRSNLHKARITVLDASVDNLGTAETEFNVLPRHLNKHLLPYYGAPAFGTPASEKAKSVATPLQMAITNDGSTLYVAGFGSNGVAVYDTTQLKNDTFAPSAANIIPIPGGPSGLLLDEASDRLYVTSRITNTMYIFDTTDNSHVMCGIRPCALAPHDPEPPEVRDGRPFLYDATLTSANGEASCGGCHIFGDMDDISWDLGDPDGDIVTPNPNPKPLVSADGPGIGALPDSPQLDSMKGPMTTQSLRGLALSGPMHWRGDRTGNQCFSIDTVGNSNCEDQAFNAFNVAFPGLIGRDTQLPTTDMQAFTNFALRLTYPPNPIRALDNSMTPEEQLGFDLYNNPARLTDTVANCNGCHVLDRSQGFFGTSGGTTFEMETQEFKVPHLRNAYQKVGMFGQMPMDFIPGSGMDMGPQVRATGFLHDGSISTVKTFLTATVFDTNTSEEANIEAFIMAFDSDLAPIVGQQVTLDHTNLAEVEARIDLMIERANTSFPGTSQRECELIVKGVVDDVPRGWLMSSGGTCDGGGNDGGACVRDVDCPGATCNYDTVGFLSDRRVDPVNWTKDDLVTAAAVPGQALTFTCAPPGSGFRMGVDRDRDNFWDYDDPFPDFFNSPDCSIGRTTPAGSAGAVLFLMALGAFARRLTIGRRRRS